MRAIKPEDILPDGVDAVSINGVELRKGTVAAFLANIDILENEAATEQAKQEAYTMLEQLAPAIVLGGLNKHVLFKNQLVAKILKDLESHSR